MQLKMQTANILHANIFLRVFSIIGLKITENTKMNFEEVKQKFLFSYIIADYRDADEDDDTENKTDAEIKEIIEKRKNSNRKVMFTCSRNRIVHTVEIVIINNGVTITLYNGQIFSYNKDESDPILCMLTEKGIFENACADMVEYIVQLPDPNHSENKFPVKVPPAKEVILTVLKEGRNLLLGIEEKPRIIELLKICPVEKAATIALLLLQDIVNKYESEKKTPLSKVLDEAEKASI
jgi:hypothetical protein